MAVNVSQKQDSATLFRPYPMRFIMPLHRLKMAGYIGGHTKSPPNRLFNAGGFFVGDGNGFAIVKLQMKIYRQAIARITMA